MKLWLISQTVNGGYGTYDSAVVAAETEDAARLTHPDADPDDDAAPWDGNDDFYANWADAKYVCVEYLGEAREGHPAGVVCASFNAG